MNIKEKIDYIKDKAARLAVKAAAVATLMSGTGAVSSCQENNRNSDENRENIERTDGTKTSVVFRSTHNSYRLSSDTDILMENGDEFTTHDNDRFLESGDTVTYETETYGMVIRKVLLKPSDIKVAPR